MSIIYRIVFAYFLTENNLPTPIPQLQRSPDCLPEPLQSGILQQCDQCRRTAGAWLSGGWGIGEKSYISVFRWFDAYVRTGRCARGMAALNRVRTYTLIDRCSPFYSNSAAMSGQNHRSNSHAKSRQVGIEKYLPIGRNHFTKPCFSSRWTGCMESWENARFRAKSHETEKLVGAAYGQDITPAILNGFVDKRLFHHTAKRLCQRAYWLRFFIK